MDDKALRDNVLAELDHDPSVDPAQISVIVRHGVVILRGHTATLAQKHAAADAAARIKGVRGIVQEIEVRPSSDALSDEKLAEGAVARLTSAVAVPPGLMVSVEDGVVTLTGVATWDYQRRIAEQEIRGLGGVLDVVNQITLAYVNPEADIKARIEGALGRSALDSTGVRVAVHGGDVELTGAVSNWYEIDLAERQAWSVAGVRSVDNRLVVTDDDHAIPLIA